MTAAEAIGCAIAVVVVDGGWRSFACAWIFNGERAELESLVEWD